MSNIPIFYSKILESDLIPRKNLVRILVVVLSVDTTNPMFNLEPLYSLPPAGEDNVNLLIFLSMGYIIYWTIRCPSHPRSRDFKTRTEMVALEIKVLTSFAKNHFKETQADCLKAMRAVVEKIIRIAVKFESKM